MKLGYHHRRLLRHLLDHPDFAHGLHTQQVQQKAESLIKMGYIDESWRVTEAGKSRLANEEARQQQQQKDVFDASIEPDIPGDPATEAELLRAQQLSLQRNDLLASYAQAKAQQIDSLQAALQTAIQNQSAKITSIQQNSPAWFVSKRTRLTWQNELTKAQARLSQLEQRSERVGQIAQASSLYADSLLNEFAARKFRFHHPDLARQWDLLQQQQRKAALQSLRHNHTIDLDLGRTRSLNLSSDA
jgi:hypothetical protein